MKLHSGDSAVSAVTSPAVNQPFPAHAWIGFTSRSCKQMGGWIKSSMHLDGLNCPNAACVFHSTFDLVNKRSLVAYYLLQQGTKRAPLPYTSTFTAIVSLNKPSNPE